MEKNRTLRVVLEEAFKSAYTQGNKDGNNGVFINPAVYLEEFLLENESDTISAVAKTLNNLHS